MLISGTAPTTVEFPREPATPVELPLTRVRVQEGIGALNRPVTHVLETISDVAGTPTASFTTFRRGLIQADTTPVLATGTAVDQATQAVHDALLGSDALRLGIDAEYRKVVLRDTVVVKWTGQDGRELATRIELDPATRRAAHSADAPLIDAIRAWEQVTGAAPALDTHLAKL